MKKLYGIFAVAFVLAFTGQTAAQYKGPGSIAKEYTVKEITKNASKLDRSDVLVKLEGSIISQINSETYWFQDSTGKIRIELEKDQLPAVPFDEKTKVIITGEVDYDLLEGSEIEVERLELK